jgi:Universal stress protein family
MRLPEVIAAPVTLAPDSARVVAAAAAFAAALGAELVLVGIAPVAPPVRPAAQLGEPLWTPPESQQRFADLLVQERLDELSGGLPFEVPVQTLMTWEPAGPALVEAARDAHAELIVVPMRRGLADHHVLDRGGVPVLVVPT